MNVAIISNLPSWGDDTAYLNELEKRLPRLGITTKIFYFTYHGIFEKISFGQNFIQAIKLTKALKKLSKFEIIHVQFTFPLGFNCIFLKPCITVYK